MAIRKRLRAFMQGRSGKFLRSLRDAWKDDRVTDLAAMMTYYAIFALFPMAIFVVTFALLVIPADAIMDAATMATRAMPAQAAGLVKEQVGRMQEAAGGGIAVGSAVMALWGASKGSIALGRTLNDVHEARETRPWWKVQLTGILVTLGVAVLLIVALGLLVVGPAVGGWVAERIGGGDLFDAAWTVGRWVGAAVLVMLIWALLYRFLPDTDAPLRVFTPGAIAAVLMWIGISLLFALYVGNFGNYEKTYGTLGGVLVFLTWLWLSNVVMLLGAEINDVLDRARARQIPEQEQGRQEADDREEAMARDEVRDAERDEDVDEGEGDGIGGLIGRLTESFKDVARDEIALARAEAKEVAKAAAIDAGVIVLGGIVALIGLGMLCAAAVAGLEPMIDALWLRLLIMAAVYLIGGGIVAGLFARKLRRDAASAMTRTREETKKTVEEVREAFQH